MNQKKPDDIPLGEVVPSREEALINAGRMVTEAGIRQCLQMGLAVVCTLACADEGPTQENVLQSHLTNTRMFGHRDGIIQSLLNAIDALEPAHQRIIFELLQTSPDFAKMRELKGVIAEAVPKAIPKLMVN